MDKKTIAKNFSRYAYFYDRYADIQKKMALELLAQIREYNFGKILEIGCGTGNYTALLRDRFKKAKIKALDISDKMVEVAQNKLKDKDIEFMVADAENVDLKDLDFDLVTANACFQWFVDLENALQKYKALLKNNGFISFSIFGPLTFWELSISLGYLLGNVSIAANNFITKDKIKNILGKYFKEVRIEEARYTESFVSLRDLLNKIKYTGIRGNGLGGKIFFRPKLLKKLEEVYLEKFSILKHNGRKIKATSQVFFCQGLVERPQKKSF